MLLLAGTRLRHLPVMLSIRNPLIGFESSSVQLNVDLPKEPAFCACRRSAADMATHLPTLQAMAHGKNKFASALQPGTTIANIGNAGNKRPIVARHANTPAAISQGITAIVGNASFRRQRQRTEGRDLCRPWANVVRLDEEEQGLMR